jgi:hypothetical protein
MGMEMIYQEMEVGGREGGEERRVRVVERTKKATRIDGRTREDIYN